MKSWMRFAPAVLLAVIFVAGLASGLTRHVSLEDLRAHHETLHAYVAFHPVTAACIFVGVFMLAVASGLPVCLMLTVTGGSLFGPWFGAGLTTFSATVGAVGTYFAARLAAGSSFSDWVARVGGTGKRIVDGFGRNAFGHILTLRLIPFFPFTPINVAAGAAAIPLRAFIPASLLGEIPSALIYARLGAGLGRALHDGGSPGAPTSLNPDILLPLLGLASMSLISTGARIWWSRRQGAAVSPGEGVAITPSVALATPVSAMIERSPSVLAANSGSNPPSASDVLQVASGGEGTED